MFYYFELSLKDFFFGPTWYLKWCSANSIQPKPGHGGKSNCSFILFEFSGFLKMEYFFILIRNNSYFQGFQLVSLLSQFCHVVVWFSKDGNVNSEAKMADGWQKSLIMELLEKTEVTTFPWEDPAFPLLCSFCFEQHLRVVFNHKLRLAHEQDWGNPYFCC